MLKWFWTRFSLGAPELSCHQNVYYFSVDFLASSKEREYCSQSQYWVVSSDTNLVLCSDIISVGESSYRTRS